MPSAYTIEFRIESLTGEKLFGFVVVGIPENQFLELKAKFPDVGFKGQNPKVNEAIKEDITKEEKDRITKKLANHSGMESKFIPEGISRYLDEAREKPSFESNGKKFWIFPHINPD